MPKEVGGPPSVERGSGHDLAVSLPVECRTRNPGSIQPACATRSKTDHEKLYVDGDPTHTSVPVGVGEDSAIAASASSVSVGHLATSGSMAARWRP